jgi:hypothetical protein
MLVAFYGAMGNAPSEPGALNLMAEKLAARATPELVNLALNRCMDECRYPVRVPDILQRIPGFDVDGDAEKRLAWETTISFCDKWVQSDGEGNYVVDRGVRSLQPPKLSDRILDTVRRTGGWRAYKRLSNDDFPFQQKRFFDEYEAWTEIQYVAADPAKVLYVPSKEPPKLLVASFELPRQPEPPSIPVPAKKFYSLPSVEQLRDRAAMAKARLAQWQLAKAAQTATTEGGAQ